MASTMKWLAVFAMVSLSGCGEDAGTSPPNLLLISIDSLRADHLGAYGYPHDTSPHLDRLAEEGVLFEQMVAETSWTLPSHVTMLTGLSSSVHGVIDDTRSLPEGSITLAQALAAQGYRTEGYASAPFLHSVFGFDRGFHHYEVVRGTIYDMPGVTLDRIAGEGRLQKGRARADMLFHSSRSAEDLARIVDQAVARLAGRPFFLFVHIFDVHYDYNPPEPYWRRFDPDYDGDLRPEGFYFNSRIHDGMPADDLRHVLALYDGEIRWTDEHVGQMLTALEVHGVADSTLVAVVSDHGDEFFEHGHKGHKRTLYDEQLLVPFLLRLPGRLPANRRVAMQTRMVDIFPTLLDLLGVEPSGPVLGKSLLPYVLREREESDLPAVSMLLDRKRTTQTLRYPNGKLEVAVSSPDLGDRDVETSRYFDLEADRAESRPSTGDPRATEALRELKETWRREVELRETLGLAAPEAAEVPAELREQLDALGYGSGGDSP